MSKCPQYKSYKTDTDEFQQMPSIGSMQEAKHSLRIAILSVLVVLLGWKKAFKWVQLHLTCPEWIHTRLILMSFGECSPLDPCKRPNTVWELPWCFLCGLGQIGSMQEAKHWYQLQFCWFVPHPGCYECVWDIKSIQMSPATQHRTVIIDPYKTDTDEFQQNSSVDPCKMPNMVWELQYCSFGPD
jgi:hypothetical protein